MKFIKIAFKTCFAFLGVVLIFLVIYLLGWEILEAPFGSNEMASMIDLSRWADRWLLKGIQWYPFHGGGLSVTQTTQTGVYYLISLCHRLFGLTVPQSARVIAFSIVLSVTFGIYFLVWWRFRSQIMALIASLFYPLSHAVWFQIIFGGYLSQSYSLIFVLPTIFSFDYYLKKKDVRFLILTVFAYGLCFWGHVPTGELMTGVLLFWALVYWLFNLSEKWWPSLKFNFWAWLKAVVLGALLISFWLFPFVRYVRIVGRNLIPFRSLEQVGYITPPFLFGFGDAWGGETNTGAILALPVLIFALLGMILALIKRDKFVLSLVFVAAGFILYGGLPFFAPRLVQVFFLNLLEQSYERAFVFPMLILPILASYGIYQLFNLLFFWLKPKAIKAFLVGILAISLSGLGIYFIRHVPPLNVNECYFGLGLAFGSRNDYCHFGDKLRYFEPYLGKDTLEAEARIKDILGKAGIGDRERMDVSPKWGYLVMSWPLFTNSSLVNVHLNPGAMSHIFWGYQVAVFYGEHEFGFPEEVANLASWFGIGHVVLFPDDPLEKYIPQYWEDISDEDGYLIKRFKGPAEMATLSSKPRILVLGKFANRAYEQFFRLAAAGAYPYGKAMIVEGRDDGRIDKYSLEELKQFDLVFLYGHAYKNWAKNEKLRAVDRQKAYQLLEAYVNQGGRLFIESGWQFFSPDWEWSQTEAIIPVEYLIWEECQNDWGSKSFKGFSPPEYKGGPWGVSAGEGLKDWAQPLLQSQGRVLMAKGNYGQGKIVWSGMNLVGHAFSYLNRKEFAFFEDQIDWLLMGLKEKGQNLKIDYQRINPDKVEFSFSQPQTNVSLYWRESFHPDWRAKLVSQSGSVRTKLKIYRSGPNFMLMPLEKVESGDKVVLELKKHWLFVLSRILPIITLSGLLLIFFRKKQFLKLKEKTKKPFKGKIMIKTKSWWNHDEG